MKVYYWTNDPIGITRMDELTSSDRKYVRQVVLMELTGLLDQYGIEIGRPPKVKNKIRGKLFSLVFNDCSHLSFYV